MFAILKLPIGIMHSVSIYKTPDDQSCFIFTDGDLAYGGYFEFEKYAKFIPQPFTIESQLTVSDDVYGKTAEIGNLSESFLLSLIIDENKAKERKIFETSNKIAEREYGRFKSRIERYEKLKNAIAEFEKEGKILIVKTSVDSGSLVYANDECLGDEVSDSELLKKVSGEIFEIYDTVIDFCRKFDIKEASSLIATLDIDCVEYQKQMESDLAMIWEEFDMRIQSIRSENKNLAEKMAKLKNNN